MKPVLKYPGAKWNLAQWIISFFPPHTNYLEPFFGSGAVLLNKKPSKVETVNDIDGRVINLFKVLRECPENLAAAIDLTPWARDEYLNSYKITGDPLEDARRFLVRCWQGTAANLNTNTGWRHHATSTPFANNMVAWNRVPELITATARRLKQVQIENKPATELVKKYNTNNVLIYADPPYPLSTRSGKMYDYEMTDADHAELLGALDAHPGPVILSGYACDLYDNRLKHWHRETKTAQAEKGQSRTEVLWINPVAAKNIQGRLF
jgi:DNA adenine methylase